MNLFLNSFYLILQITLSKSIGRSVLFYLNMNIFVEILKIPLKIHNGSFLKYIYC